MLWDPERLRAEAAEHVAPDRLDEVVGAARAGWVLAEAEGPAARAVRVGGAPDLAAHETWPHSAGGTPMVFVGQVDLDALPPIPPPWDDPRPAAASSGLLRLFADLAENAYEGGAATALLAPAGVAVAPAPPPEWPADWGNDGEDDRLLGLPHVAAAATPFLTLPESLPGLEPFDGTPAGEAYNKLAMRVRVAESAEWLEDLMRDGPNPWELSHLFGHAVSIQDDTRYAAAHEHPDVPDHQDWTVLLGIHSGWGGIGVLDGGAYHIMSPTADLRDGRWDRLSCDVSSC
jgi:hypothetical protein